MTVTRFADLPVADTKRRWNGDAAERRVRRWSRATDEPNARYRKAHLWYDADAEQNFTAYKMLIADVIDGELHVVPRAVMAAGGVLDGARGGVDIPPADVKAAKRHLARYYAKWDETPPWNR